jgi:hypothetical protein
MHAFTERVCAGVWPRTRWRDTVSALRSTMVLAPMAEMVSPCRTFDVSATCYRYSPPLSDETEEIADLWADTRKSPQRGSPVRTAAVAQPTCRKYRQAGQDDVDRVCSSSVKAALHPPAANNQLPSQSRPWLRLRASCGSV